MKITIYELLGLIKDGKAPKKIKYEDETFNYVKTNRDGISYVNESKNYKDISRYLIYCIESLNDEVEIIEDKPKVTVEMTEEEYFRYLDAKNIGNQPIEDEFIDIEEFIFGEVEDAAHYQMKEKINSLIKNQKKIIERLNK